MTIQHEGDQPLLFAAGVLPARKALVSVAAQKALLALTEDLLHPGVHRAANYHLIRYVSALEVHLDGYSIGHLDALRRGYHNDGLIDDDVNLRVVAYIAERLRFANEGGE